MHQRTKEQILEEFGTTVQQMPPTRCDRLLVEAVLDLRAAAAAIVGKLDQINNTLVDLVRKT